MFVFYVGVARTRCIICYFACQKVNFYNVNNGGLQNVLEETKTNFIGHCLSGEIGKSLFQIRS